MGPIFPRKALRPTVKRLVINVTEQFVRFSVRNEDPADPLRATIVTQIPDGFVELWFADRESMEAMYRSDFAKQLVADAGNFVGSIATFIVDERAIPAPASSDDASAPGRPVAPSRTRH